MPTHIYFPPCAGIYHYWFGVAKAIQEAFPDEVLKEFHYHTISGSGYPVASLLSGFCVRQLYLLWGKRLDFLSRRFGWGFIYHLAFRHSKQVIDMAIQRRGGRMIKNHTSYCTTFPGFRFAAPQFTNPTSYANVLTASSIIPFVSLKSVAFERGRMILDGGLNPLLTGRSPFKLIARQVLKPGEKIIHLGKVLKYKSVKTPNWSFFWGLFQGSNRTLFQNGYDDMKEHLDVFDEPTAIGEKIYPVFEETRVDLLNYQWNVALLCGIGILRIGTIYCPQTILYLKALRHKHFS